jgi:hypothetical protein
MHEPHEPGLGRAEFDGLRHCDGPCFEPRPVARLHIFEKGGHDLTAQHASPGRF